MLYSDLIELRRDEIGAGAWNPGAARRGSSSIDGHGTGLSTGVGTDVSSFAPASTHGSEATGSGWTRVTQALSVMGNVLAGALFLGGLYFVPLALERLATYLALL